MARSAWSGEPAPPVRMLPDRLPVQLLPDKDSEPDQVPIGVEEAALQLVRLDLFGSDQHLLVLGDGACGKTNLLRLLVAGLCARYTDKELVFAVVDPRRQLQDLVPEQHLGGYAHNPQSCASLAAGVAKELAKRTDLVDPRVVVLVDDYDLLASTGQRPLETLLPYLPAGRDIGVHFVVSRRVAGAARAMFDPFLLGLRENGATGLVLAGDRSEGQLFPDVYAGPQPPGRGWLVRRGEPGRLVQTALDPGTP